MNDDLPSRLARALAAAPAQRLCVAFSGGPDSTALLHALAQLPAARGLGLRALHIDHGLHPESAAWARHCAGFCHALEVPLTTLRVEVGDPRKQGIEAAARHARYAAFAENLGEGEWLALAHHRDDQVETVLLKLLRGAGPEGLAGMRALRPFAQGSLWRPLLETSREDIAKYLNRCDLAFIDDPANVDPRMARNLLRHDILPRLRRQWPGADAAIVHAARLCRAAADYIGDATNIALASLQREAGSLDAAGWRALPDALRAPVLDAWLHAHDLAAPPDSARAELARQVARAAPDRVPVITWGEVEVRVWDARLHAMPTLAPPPTAWHAPWDGARLMLPRDCGELALVGRTASAVRLDPPLQIRFRRGGERIRPLGSAHTRELRDLFQAAGMPPWLRERCPLIYAGDTLIAVADRWVSEPGRATFDRAGGQPCWTRDDQRGSARHA